MILLDCCFDVSGELKVLELSMVNVNELKLWNRLVVLFGIEKTDSYAIKHILVDRDTNPSLDWLCGVFSL